MGSNMKHTAQAPACDTPSCASPSRTGPFLWCPASTGKHAVSAVAAFLLLGCAASPPQGTRPELAATASSFRNMDVSTAFDALWWQSFADPRMADLVARALESNHDVQIAAQRVAQARAGSMAAASRLLPTVGLTASASDQRTTLGDEFKRGLPDTRAYRAALELGWEIDVMGGARASANAAELDALAAEAGVRAARLAVASEVARQITLHRSARLRLALLQTLLESHLKTEAMTRRLHADGVASALDVTRAAADARALSALIPPLTLLAAATEHHVAVLLGQSPGTPVAELRHLGSGALPAVPQLQPGQPADLLLRRPDLQAAEKLWLAEGARLQEVRADTWPKLFMSGVLGGQDLSLNLLNTGPVRYSNLALAFTMPLFNAGRLKANVERQTVRERTATLQWEQATLKALQDVENSLVALTQERARSVALDAVAHERSQTLKQLQSLAREGQVSQLRVFEAQRGQMSAELTALESRTDLALSGIQLYRALGGGWETQAGQQTRPPGQPAFNNPTTPAIAQIQGQP